MRPLHLLALALLPVLLAGCGVSGRRPVYAVHGTVFDSHDKPAAGALVVFHPTGWAGEEIIKPLGYVQDDGTFVLTTYTKEDGAPEGEYSVAIEWLPPKTTPFGSRKPRSDKLEGRYSDPAHSKIHFKVDPKPENEVPRIRLE